MTIIRDKATGIPHINGTTRSGTEFGAGYAAGQDRLWLMDLLRHVGRGELTPFAGGAARQPGPGAELWRNSPRTPRPTCRRQVDALRDSRRARRSSSTQDVQDYVDGINAYIDDTVGGR